MPARMAMMAMTTSSSMRVKALKPHLVFGTTVPDNALTVLGIMVTSILDQYFLAMINLANMQKWVRLNVRDEWIVVSQFEN